MKAVSDSWKLLALYLLLAAATYFAFGRVTQLDFIVYDDSDYVTGNSHIQRGLTWDAALWAFRTFHAGNWHPLTWISHMADVQFYGLDPGLHHLTNLEFHLLNTLLVFTLFRRMTGELWRSAFVAALFGLHPLHVESVAWVAERKDVLSTFFGLLSLYGYVRFAETDPTSAGLPFGGGKRPKRLWYWSALIMFGLGLMAKPMLVTWPFVMLLLDLWPMNRLRIQGTLQIRMLGKLLVEKSPFFALSAISSVVTVEAQKHGEAVMDFDTLPLSLRIGNVVLSYARYLGKAFWPTDLSILYLHPREWPMEAVLGALVLLSLLSFLVMWLAQRRAYALTGWFWFLGTLVPVLGVVQVGSQAMADRYTYVPLLGIFIILSWGAGDALGRIRYGGVVSGVLSLVAVAACFLLTRERVELWKDTETLFRECLRVTPDNFIAHDVLGVAYAGKGKVEEAVSQFREAVRLNPRFAQGINNLGRAFADSGRSDEANDQFIEALRLKPTLYIARNNLGELLMKRGHLQEAIGQFSEVVQVVPDFPAGHLNLGGALVQAGRLKDACEQFEIVLRLDPGCAEAHYRLGLAFFGLGRFSEAEAQFRSVLALEPSLAIAHSSLGMALAAQGDLENAIASYNTAIRCNPSLFVAHRGLGILLEQKGLVADAEEQFRAALTVFKDDWEVQDRLGLLLGKQGKLEESSERFSEALRINPTNASVRLHRSVCLGQMGKSKEALEGYREVLRLDPNQLEALNNLAWALATSPDPEMRSGREAVELAERACEITSQGQAFLLGTLAAAYAEAGRFPEAVLAAGKARDLALTAGQKDLAGRNVQLMELYRAGKPYHEPGGDSRETH